MRVMGFWFFQQEVAASPVAPSAPAFHEDGDVLGPERLHRRRRQRHDPGLPVEWPGWVQPRPRPRSTGPSTLLPVRTTLTPRPRPTASGRLRPSNNFVLRHGQAQGNTALAVGPSRAQGCGGPGQHLPGRPSFFEGGIDLEGSSISVKEVLCQLPGRDPRRRPSVDSYPQGLRRRHLRALRVLGRDHPDERGRPRPPSTNIEKGGEHLRQGRHPADGLE